MGAGDTRGGAEEGAGSTSNQLGDVSGAAVQARYIDSVTFNLPSPASAPRPPRQVPAVSGRFVNRALDFTRAEKALVTSANAPGVRIGLISGLPGVGKSWFARRFAERGAARYSGGQLYADFAGTTQTVPPSAADVLAGFLVALGVSLDVIPSTIEEKANLYRTLTSDDPFLVVLDEVTDPAVVSPLVPRAPGSVVLVTSNDQLAELSILVGAEPVPLDPLNSQHGSELLAELVGDRIEASSEATAELVRQCGGLPVALQVAAARLRVRPTLTVARLVADIADDSRGLRGFTLGAFGSGGENRVSAVFTLAYQELPEPVAQVYRQVGLLPVPSFTLELAAAATGLELDVVEDRLLGLVAASLLTEEDAGRYRFHGLVWRHAREQADANDAELERRAVLRRAVDHVVVMAAFADLAALGPERLRCTPHDTVLAHRADPFADADAGRRGKRALDWMDHARGMALALLRTAVEHSWFDAAWQLAESMTALFVVRRYLVDWTVFSDWGIRAAQAAQAPAAEARLRSFVSRAWTELDNPARAGQELHVALNLVRELDQPRLLASVHEMYGRWYDHAGDYESAQQAYREAGALFEGVDDDRGASYVQYFLGMSLAAQEEWTTALGVLTDARERIHSLGLAGSDRMEGRAWLGVGRVQQHLGRYTQALSAVRAAAAVFASGEYTFYEAQAHELLAEFAEQRGDTADAIASLRQATELHKRLKSPREAELRARLVRLMTA